VGVAAVGSALMSSVVFYGAALKGSLLVFWMVYLATLCVGISEWQVRWHTWLHFMNQSGVSRDCG
jgi:hypothetical protein